MRFIERYARRLVHHRFRRLKIAFFRFLSAICELRA